MEQEKPYILGIEKIEGYYSTHDITTDTAKHAHVIEIPDEVLESRISIPGYKYNQPKLDKDFLIEFKHEDEYFKISYSDMAIDLYHKMRYNPGILIPISKFITNIGIHGDATPVPDELLDIKVSPPMPALVAYVEKHIAGHRMNFLKFGIPIIYYPKILYWLGMNEEINYAPKNNAGWGGRRTPIKRLLEIIYVAALGNLRKDNRLQEPDAENLLLVLRRIKAGKNPVFEPFPKGFQSLFSIIDAYEHAT